MYLCLSVGVHVPQFTWRAEKTTSGIGPRLWLGEVSLIRSSWVYEAGLWALVASPFFTSDLAVKNSRIISQCHWVPSFAWILEVLTVVSQTLHSLSHPPPPPSHPPVFSFSKVTKDKELGTLLCSWAWAGIWNPLCQLVMIACWGVSTSSWVVLNTPEHPGQFPKQSSTWSETVRSAEAENHSQICIWFVYRAERGPKAEEAWLGVSLQGWGGVGGCSLRFLSPKLTERKQHLWHRGLQEGGIKWLWLVAQTIINGSACPVPFSESERDWTDQQLSLNGCFILSQSALFIQVIQGAFGLQPR